MRAFDPRCSAINPCRHGRGDCVAIAKPSATHGKCQRMRCLNEIPDVRNDGVGRIRHGVFLRRAVMRRLVTDTGARSWCMTPRPAATGRNKMKCAMASSYAPHSPLLYCELRELPILCSKCLVAALLASVSHMDDWQHVFHTEPPFRHRTQAMMTGIESISVIAPANQTPYRSVGFA